ncbi:HEAT repeat domain-containing protein [Cryptosporangium aurantiacum]|uniref:HEAT repeat n=1 Tax=Cryptosporangium aurantiacum TaxID=134849 RepID=A0A1M7R1D9_9ACTN|nr:HEAT repeat domain-containing protein [Cryptosporangium aurantiacum]SHN38465.1 HEAT repeat [Cryptosporangium aurantiacum]
MSDALAGSGILGWSVAAVLGLCAALVVVTAVRRLWVEVSTRRRAALEDPVRPLVLTLAADADEDGDALRTLAAVPTATWVAVEPLVVRVLGKVRGEARGVLTGLLESRGAAQRARRDIHRRSAVRRARAAETLGLLGDESSIEVLRERLADRSPDVRRVAVRALGRIGDPSVAPALIGALDGARTVPAQSVIQAVLRLGTRAAPPLLPALHDESETVRAAVAEIFGLLRAVAATQALVASVTEDPSLDVRVRAAKALGAIGHPAGVDALVGVIRSAEHSTLRAAAARGLGELGSERAVRVLIPLLYERVHVVADAAATSLLQLGAPGRTALTTVLSTARPGPVFGRTVTDLHADWGSEEALVALAADVRSVSTAACYAAAALDADRRVQPE